ncbi:MAG: CsiV family protein [Gammaproteobacteria bacterium]|jgi:hypothetical protein
MHDLFTRTGRDRQRAVRRLLLPLAVLLCQGEVYGAAADEPLQYDVEVIVFRNLNPRTDGELGSSYAADTGDRFASVPLQSDQVELSREQHTLDNVAGALQRSGAYRVLAHRAWRQTAYDRSNTVPYRLQPSGRDAPYELDGTIRLIRERFLHLDVDLVLRKERRYDEPGTAGFADGPVYRLNETRRVRSNELHYFDNPWFGVIAKVTPHEQPASPDTAGGEDAQTGDLSGLPDAVQPATNASAPP